MYSISIKMGDTVLESEGASMSECLTKLPKPVKIFQKGIITLKKDKKQTEFFWMPVRLKRIWMKSSPIYLAKSWELMVA